MRLSLCIAIASVACSTTPGLTLVATPSALTGDGQARATLTATVSGATATTTPVHFAASLGVFDGSTGDGTTLDVTADQTGIATATLVAPRQGWGTINVTATAAMAGKSPTAQTAIQLAPSGGPAASLTFSCQHQNVGAFVHGRLTTLHLLCTATARDTSGKVIKNASVQTLTEAGSLDWVNDDSDDQQFVYSVRPDDKPPVDVGPLASDGKTEQQTCPVGCTANPFGSTCQGEPCWTDSGGIIHNPRDGVVTLVAALPAVKGYDNEGEPYVDANDNGKHDPGEPYIDFNGNGKWDGPSGAIQDHMVWATYRVIWSGEAQVTATGGSRTAHDSFIEQIKSDATHGEFVLHLFDRNLNALAADGASATDGITWNATCPDGTLTLANNNQLMEQIKPGIAFSPDTGAISAPGSRTTYVENTDYHTGYTFSPGTAGATVTCGLTAAPQRQYDPGAPGFSGEGSNPDAVIAGGASF